jgi:hypothetical protein
MPRRVAQVVRSVLSAFTDLTPRTPISSGELTPVDLLPIPLGDGIPFFSGLRDVPVMFDDPDVIEGPARHPPPVPRAQGPSPGGARSLGFGPCRDQHDQAPTPSCVTSPLVNDPELRPGPASAGRSGHLRSGTAMQNDSIRAKWFARCATGSAAYSKSASPTEQRSNRSSRSPTGCGSIGGAARAVPGRRRTRGQCGSRGARTRRRRTPRRLARSRSPACGARFVRSPGDALVSCV